MSPNGISSNFGEILIFSSSESSDSESLLQEDLKSNGNGINKQWEAIERTLYQEPGEQVTDPQLVKECKLWRETFPHFRVKGNKVDLKPIESDEDSETDKNTQTLKKHFDLKKLEEKRQSIKNKVVGMLVDRLIAKHGPSKANLLADKNGVKIEEIEPEEKPVSLPQKSNAIKPIGNYEPSKRTEKESYFERGKIPTNRSVPEEGRITKEQPEKSLQELFDSWDKESKRAIKLPKPNPLGEPRKAANATSRDSFSQKSISPKTRRGRPKPKQFPPPIPLDDIIKPFEMTKKIDKKYEGLLEKIMERKYKEMGITRHCPTSASSGLEMKSYRESLEKLRIGDGFGDSIKRNTMPRINKLTSNNWLKRREINRYFEEADMLPKNAPNPKPNRQSNFNSYNESDQDMGDDRFLEDLRKEMRLNYKRPSLKNGVIEEISLPRPKPLKLEKPSKCPSCADFSGKVKKETKVRRPKNGPERSKNELNLKNRGNNPSKKGSNLSVNPNPLFPPIECGLICTEITGRPKVGHKIAPKKY